MAHTIEFICSQCEPRTPCFNFVDCPEHVCTIVYVLYNIFCHLRKYTFYIL